MIRWLTSATARQASALAKHVTKLLNHQRDILSPQALTAIREAQDDLQSALADKADKAALEKQMEHLEQTANKWLKPYPYPGWRENVEVLLVALAIAMGIRTFFLQPFKIPTGSMQPTLFGVVSTPDYSRGMPQDPAAKPEIKLPTGLERLREWFAGVSYVRVRAKTDGALEKVGAPFKILIFSLAQSLEIGGRTHWILFPPDYGGSTLEGRAGLRRGQQFKEGEEVVKMRVINGDHLFVDRLTYNFRPPERGEIVVFETKGIPRDYREQFNIPGDQFYIKRLIGLGGEQIRFNPDRHVSINGNRLDASTPRFEKVYGFDPKEPPRDSRYSGHIDGPALAPFFADKQEGYTIPKAELMVLGDNTVSSLDSRFWGAFPAKYVIGKAYFVYWPISDRFGWGYRR